ncbi:PREDICTED: succinate dehydrogenase assembly factor 4, mitochondrial [Drosophila arizonae]|uniref:Succinate dehydrogenase assembly factor 4, mitochondrial n=1 Tax=Drosophila arizonae TaxID=7263 RepID=A0ABM1NZZ8_DROAR|nr:PREDICTED: succinate dehydrogenase assembly factor 4, mitochondrial [Drosophila arizonae]
MFRCIARSSCLLRVPVRFFSASSVIPKALREQKEVDGEQKKRAKAEPSERYLKFKEKLLSEVPLTNLPKTMPHPAHEKEPLKRWPNNTNPHTGEIGGPPGPEPTRYGDWESKGRVTDF